MFATYLTLAREACEAVKAHKDRLVGQIAQILADGVKQGASRLPMSRSGARACSTPPPASIIPPMPTNGGIRDSARIDAVLALLLRGLEAPRKR